MTQINRLTIRNDARLNILLCQFDDAPREINGVGSDASQWYLPRPGRDNKSCLYRFASTNNRHAISPVIDCPFSPSSPKLVLVVSACACARGYRNFSSNDENFNPTDYYSITPQPIISRHCRTSSFQLISPRNKFSGLIKLRSRYAVIHIRRIHVFGQLIIRWNMDIFFSLDTRLIITSTILYVSLRK